MVQFQNRRDKSFFGPHDIFLAMALYGNMALKMSVISAVEVKEKWDRTHFEAHKISALCFSFLNACLLTSCCLNVLYTCCGGGGIVISLTSVPQRSYVDGSSNFNVVGILGC